MYLSYNYERFMKMEELEAKKEFFNNYKAILFENVDNDKVTYEPTFVESCIVLRLQENKKFLPNTFHDVRLGVKLSVPYGYYLSLHLKQMLHVKYRLMLTSGDIVKSNFKRELVITLWNPTNNEFSLEAGVPLVNGFLNRMSFAISKKQYEERFGKKINFHFID